MIRTWLVILAFMLLAVRAGGDAAAQQAGDADWRADWELADGLTMETDTKGFALPTQIMFVKNPGTGPKDPLYFVIELKGTLKVVTNDRSVQIFAKDFLPNPQGQAFVPTGAAGICLDPKNGYVFATFAYLDNTSIYRNGIARFTTTPGTFGLKAQETELFLELFKDEISATSHQIGPCQVRDDLLYASVGYGDDRAAGQNLYNTLGSIIRMTLDFKPLPDNPFYEDERQDKSVNYIWAYGFRNLFGLKFVGDRLFATENGGSIDRFNEIEKGENYLWDGSDLSMGARAAQLFSPSVGIVQLDFIPPDSPLFPEGYQGRFVAASAGVPNVIGPGVRGARSILMWEFDFDKRRMAGVPRVILRYRGKGKQIPVSVALGPDALYFAALFPNSAGTSPVYKIRYDPAAKYPFVMGASRSPEAMINQYKCRQCHLIDGGGGKAGPPLGSDLVARLAERLNRPDYAERVASLDKIDAEPYAEFRKARADILASKGEERVKRWLPYYLRQPKFDNPNVEMPTLGLSAADANAIAKYLIRTTTKSTQNFSPLDHLRFAVARWIPDLRYRHLVISFIIGVIATAAFLALFAQFRRRRRRG